VPLSMHGPSMLAYQFAVFCRTPLCESLLAEYSVALILIRNYSALEVSFYPSKLLFAIATVISLVQFYGLRVCIYC